MKPCGPADVLRFISMFAGCEKTFMEGMCYWFAFILTSRFDGEILYDPIMGHFLARIDGALYDVRGDVTSEYQNWTHTLSRWDEYAKNDPKHRERIVQDCILKTSRKIDTEDGIESWT